MNGQIVMFGGEDENDKCHKNIEVYDVGKNSWKVHQLQMPVALVHHHCIVYDEAAGEFAV